MALPTLTPEQRKAALDAAHATRTARAQIKRDIKAGTVDPAHVLANRRDNAPGGITVVQFIAALPRYGRARAETICTELGIDPSKHLRGLGTRQARHLANRITPTNKEQ